MNACQKGEDPVVHRDQEEFNAEERQMISGHLQGVINEETSIFAVLDPQSSTEVSELYQYLDDIFQSLVNTVTVVHRNDLIWSVHILRDDEEKNTFITPGGAFYITTGMLKTLQTEHELINVMAHEIYYADGEVLLTKLIDEFGGGYSGRYHIG